MPDNNKISELLAKIRGQVEQMNKPSGVPVHANVLQAFELLTEVLDSIDQYVTQDDYDDAALQQAVTALQQQTAALVGALTALDAELAKNTAADAEERAKLAKIRTNLDDLVKKVNELPFITPDEVDGKISAALEPLNRQVNDIFSALNNVREDIGLVVKDLGDLSGKHNTDIAAVYEKIAELEAKINAGGITAAEALALIEEGLTPVNEALQKLQDQDSALAVQIAGILADITELKAAIRDHITKEEAQNLIDKNLKAVIADIQTLQEQDRNDDNRIKNLQAKMATLEEQIKACLTGKEAEDLIDRKLRPIKKDIEDLAGQNAGDDARIKNLITRVEALENRPPGGGISADDVRRIIREELPGIKEDVEALKQFRQSAAERLQNIELLLQNPPQAWIAEAVRKTEEKLTPRLDVIEAKAEAAITPDELNPILQPLKEQISQKADNTRVNNLETEVGKKADKTDLAGKADKTYVDDELKLKTDKSYVDDELKLKTDKTYVDDGLVLKADKSYVDDELKLKTDKTYVDDGLVLKADKVYVDDELKLKTDKTYVDDGLVLKADKVYVDDELKQKADKTYVDDELKLKTDKTYVDDELKQKADKTYVDDELKLKTDKIYVDDELKQKADKTYVDDELKQKTDKIYVDDELKLKTDKTYVDDELKLKADKTYVDDGLVLKADKSYVDDGLDHKADKKDIHRIDQEIDDLREEWLEEDQNSPGVRLARVCLTGTGIVGGLELHSDEKDCLTIAPGTAVAPDGHLIVEPEKRHFTHCRTFHNAAAYPFFQKPDNGGHYKVWELLEPSGHLGHARPLTPQTAEEHELPFITDKVVLLLPEGKHLHYLLLNREDLLAILDLYHQCNRREKHNADYIYPEDYSPEDDLLTDEDLIRCFHPAIKLPEIPLFRFGFFAAEECDPADLDQTEFPEVKTIDDLYITWGPIIEDAVKRLERVVNLTIRWYHPALFPLLKAEHFRHKLSILSIKWTRFTTYNDAHASGDDTKYYTQYFYDWLRDLIAAYHELRSGLIDLMAELRPLTPDTLNLQYRHLLLGPAHQPDSSGLDPALRDAFRQPPVYNGNADRLETCRLYYRRLFKMIEGFYLEDYAGPGTDDTPAWCTHEDDDGMLVDHTDFSKMRITPGKNYSHPLSEQSIPFYYPLSDSPESLQHFWNYSRAKTLSADRLLSYHATDNPDRPSYSRRREVVRPLYYTLDGYDFYRVEGHIGKSKWSAQANLDNIIRKHNLDFTYKIIEISRINQNGILYNDESFNVFIDDILGAEHLAGIPKGGTLILVTDEDDSSRAASNQKKETTKTVSDPRIIADFSLPYHISWDTADAAVCKDGLDRLGRQIDQNRVELERLYSFLHQKVDQTELENLTNQLAVKVSREDLEPLLTAIDQKASAAELNQVKAELDKKASSERLEALEIKINNKDA